MTRCTATLLTLCLFAGCASSRIGFRNEIGGRSLQEIEEQGSCGCPADHRLVCTVNGEETYQGAPGGPCATLRVDHHPVEFVLTAFPALGVCEANDSSLAPEQAISAWRAAVYCIPNE